MVVGRFLILIRIAGSLQEWTGIDGYPVSAPVRFPHGTWKLLRFFSSYQDR